MEESVLIVQAKNENTMHTETQKAQTNIPEQEEADERHGRKQNDFKSHQGKYSLVTGKSGFLLTCDPNRHVQSQKSQFLILYHLISILQLHARCFSCY
jgi:hypothetical protein